MRMRAYCGSERITRLGYAISVDQQVAKLRDADFRARLFAETPNPERNAYFGETHVHTSYSLDAYIGGARLTPSDAYRFAKGETVIMEGSGGAAFFLIDSGEATVTRKGVELGTLGPGDHFGELSLLGERHLGEVVTSETPLTVFVLSRPELARLERVRKAFPTRNAVIRAVTKTALSRYKLDVFGIEDGFLGLIQNRMRKLEWQDVSNILTFYMGKNTPERKGYIMENMV